MGPFWTFWIFKNCFKNPSVIEIIASLFKHTTAKSNQIYSTVNTSVFSAWRANSSKILLLKQELSKVWRAYSQSNKLL